jgi:hypothetical protein
MGERAESIISRESNFETAGFGPIIFIFITTNRIKGDRTYLMNNINPLTPLEFQQ